MMKSTMQLKKTERDEERERKRKKETEKIKYRINAIIHSDQVAGLTSREEKRKKDG